MTAHRHPCGAAQCLGKEVSGNRRVGGSHHHRAGLSPHPGAGKRPQAQSWTGFDPGSQPKVQRLPTSSAGFPCETHTRYRAGPRRGSQPHSPCAGAVLGWKLLRHAPQLQRYGTKDGEELPTSPALPGRGTGNAVPRGEGRTPEPEKQTLWWKVQTQRSSLNTLIK